MKQFARTVEAKETKLRKKTQGFGKENTGI